MPKYLYSARTKSGEVQKGEIEAGSRNHVVDMLHTKGLIVVNVTESSGFDLSSLTQMNVGGVPLNEKVIFMRQLATMISAGLPLSQSLEILQMQAQNAVFKRALKEVVTSVEGGSSLADALAKQEGIFDNMVISLIAAGEESGNLEEIFKRLADQMEDDREFKAKVQGAMIYPAIILAVIVIVVGLLLVFMVPTMTDVYDEFDAVLPWPTLLMVTLSNIVINYWWLIVAIAAVVGGSFASYRKSPAGKEYTDTLFLKVPVFGQLSKNVATAEFTRTLSMLIRSGIPIVQALEITANAMENAVFHKAIMQAARSIEKGVALAKPIAEEENFPLIVSQMIAVGEETGKLSDILEKLAEYFTSEVNHTVDNLTKLMEPFILIFMGGTVGFIAVAVYLPLYSLGDVIK